MEKVFSGDGKRAGEAFSVHLFGSAQSCRMDVGRVQIGLTAWATRSAGPPGLRTGVELPITWPELSGRHRICNCLWWHAEARHGKQNDALNQLETRKYKVSSRLTD